MWWIDPLHTSLPCPWRSCSCPQPPSSLSLPPLLRYPAHTQTSWFIHHLQAKLSLRLQTRLMWLKGIYQYITLDISAFCDVFSQV
ncbi:hypothetical protein BC835DRAFT_1371151 [Cytidiella melzeri]|nr:hypothetical protein BC835DRAFT_1371151 [Cytidiella melzeri]